MLRKLRKMIDKHGCTQNWVAKENWKDFDKRHAQAMTEFDKWEKEAKA